MNEFSQAIKMARLSEFSSAKRFWRQNQSKIDCSYQMYIAIEKGTVPSLQLAVKIIEVLGMDEENLLFAWMRSSLQSPRLRSYFEKNSEPYVVNQTKTTASQKALLEELPEAYDVIIFISLFSDKKNLTPGFISKELGISLERVRILLRKLRSVNILPINSSKIEFTDWFIIPDNDQFRSIRKRNFAKYMHKQLLGVFQEDTSIQNLTIRLASKKQIDELKGKIYGLTQWFMNLKDDSGEKPYSLMVGGGLFSFKDKPRN